MVDFDENGWWDDFRGLSSTSSLYYISCEGGYEIQDTRLEGYWGGGEICQFYNVLWVEKKEDVYYRVACGRIAEKTWIANRPEEIDVVLG